jgi:predicted TIM-barrel fold metal-dependent hydrolase
MIDVHVHLGVSQSTGKLTTEKNILDAISTYKLEMVMVMPQPTDPDRPAVHEQIYGLTQRFPGRIAGIANLDPRVETAVYEKQFIHCIEELKFVAVKVHTHGFALPADAPAWEKVYALAAERQLPVMVHTGIGREIADPSRVASAAARYPRIPFVLCHAGVIDYIGAAIETASRHQNVYLEPSWCPTFAVFHMLKALGSKRIMFGSDHLDNIPVEVARYNVLGLSDEQRADIYTNTARRVFRLPGSPPG